MSANGLHRIRWRRVAVERIHRTAASQFARDNFVKLVHPLVLTPLGLTLAILAILTKSAILAIFQKCKRLFQ